MPYLPRGYSLVIRVVRSAAAFFVFLAAAAGTEVVSTDFQGTSDGLAFDASVVPDSFRVGGADFRQGINPNIGICKRACCSKILEEGVEQLREVTLRAQWDV